MGKRQKRRQKAKAFREAKEQPVQVASQPKGSGRKGIDAFYHDNYLTLLIIPFAILIAAIIILGVNYASNGQLVDTGVSLKGGLVITIPTLDAPVDVTFVESTLLAAYPDNDVIVREVAEFGTQQAVTIEAAPTVAQESELEELGTSMIGTVKELVPTVGEDYSIEVIGPSLGQSFFAQTLKALFIAFMFMGLVVFYYFGEGTLKKFIATILAFVASAFVYAGGGPLVVVGLIVGVVLILCYALWSVPSVAVILAALSDMIVTLAVISLFDFKLGTAGVAAFLMLIGYSVDTDILLSTRVVKRKEGSVYDRIKSAIGTGLLMNVSTLAAVTVALIITQSDTIRQIMIILLVGLLVDIINTWIQNAGILRWYAEKKGL